MRPVREKLENWGKLAWLPILTVASFSLMVGYCNYRLQISGQRPNLLFTNGDADQKIHFLRLYWHNGGRSVAWRGRAKLYSFEGGKRSEQPLESAEVNIAGAAAKVLPGYSGQAEFRFTSEIPNRFLVCVQYFDDDKHRYEQVFLLSLKEGNSAVSVTEDRPPNEASCH